MSLLTTSRHRPREFSGLSALLAAVLFLASDLPARRAAPHDPALTLKAE
jgi:hypothetical protein